MIDAPFPSSAQPGSGVPGWGIALLVLVCILVALAIIYVIALVSAQSLALTRVPLWAGPPRSPSTSYLPRLCVSADERTVGSWTSFRPGMPTIL